MDLGAFLPPGGSYSIKIKAGEDRGEMRGRLFERRGHPFWMAENYQESGRILNITLEMPGFRLADDGALLPADSDVAYVAILGQVHGCRFIPLWKKYALRIKLLGRVWP